MINYESKLEIELALINCSDKKLAISIIRNYVSEPILLLKKCIEIGAPFVTFTLDKVNYFDGWKIVYQLAENLVEQGFELRITVNGKSRDFNYLIDVKNKVKNLKLEDIR